MAEGRPGGMALGLHEHEEYLPHTGGHGHTVCTRLPFPLPVTFVSSADISTGICGHSRGGSGLCRRRGIGCGTPEETGDRKSNRLEGGTALKISWRCGLLSWSLEEEELSREGEGADFQVQKRIRAGTPRFEI